MISRIIAINYDKPDLSTTFSDIKASQKSIRKAVAYI